MKIHQKKKKDNEEGFKEKAAAWATPKGKANPSRTTWLHSHALKSAQVHVVTTLVAARPTPRNFIPTDSLKRVKDLADRSRFERLQIQLR